MTQLALHFKLIDGKGNINERIIWKVPKSPRYPDGVRYRLAYIRGITKEVLALYDNHPPKGHHKHVQGIEAPYAFCSVEQLLQDFKQNVKEAAPNENA